MQHSEKRFLPLLAVLFLSVATSVYGQRKAGHFSLIPRVGIVNSGLFHEEMVVTDATASATNDQDLRRKIDFTGGMEFQYQVSETQAISVGLSYTVLGSIQKRRFVMTGDGQRYVDYLKVTATVPVISVPIMGRYYLTPMFSVGLGLQPEFNLNGQMRTGANGYAVALDKNGNEQPGVVDGSSYSSSYKEDIKPGKRVGMSIPISAALEYENVILEARYHYGFTTMFRNSDGHSSRFSLCVGYRFQL